MLGQLNCNTNQPKNLQLRDGCLAITAARETEMYGRNITQKYTAAKITTRKIWTYGRFEIRAALPRF